MIMNANGEEKKRRKKYTKILPMGGDESTRTEKTEYLYAPINL